MNDAWHYQVKAAQRDLITMAGGIERAAQLTGYSKSVAGRWNSPSDPEQMPLTAVRILEKETDQPLITSIMAHETGRKVTEPNGPVTDAAVLEGAGRELIMAVAELVGNITHSATDSFVTPAEATVMQVPAGKARDALRKVERLIGAFKAQGGGPSDLRLVAED
jgi:hypothetical protein